MDKKAEYRDICERVEVERAFILAKRKFGLAQIRTYLKETTQTVIAVNFGIEFEQDSMPSILALVWQLLQ